jgi:RNA polymerase sigma-70 factor (ECF subfamily)
LSGTVPFGKAADFSHDIAALYRRYRDSLRRYVTNQFGSGPPDPEDVVQVVFEKYAATLNSSTVLNPKAFLFRSARNYVIDQRRRQAVRADYEKVSQEIADKADDLNGERVLGAKQRLLAVEQAISQLDPRSREMLIMSRIQGLSSAEIARREGCSPTLVKSIIARALVTCLQALGEGEQ